MDDAEPGRLLIEAKQALEYGLFEAMIESDLPFGVRGADGTEARLESLISVASRAADTGTRSVDAAGRIR
jgi:hypothetical protein